MSATVWAQFLTLAMLFAVLTAPIGRYMARVHEGGPTPGDRLFLPVERALYLLGGVDPDREQRWPGYALALVAFSLSSTLALYGLLRLQQHLPLNPRGCRACRRTSRSTRR